MPTTHTVRIPPQGWYTVEVIEGTTIVDGDKRFLRIPMEILEGAHAGYKFPLVCQITSLGRSMCRNLAQALGTECCLPASLDPDGLTGHRMKVFARRYTDIVHDPGLRVIEVHPIPSDPLSGDKLVLSPPGWPERKRSETQAYRHLLGPRRCLRKGNI